MSKGARVRSGCTRTALIAHRAAVREAHMNQDADTSPEPAGPKFSRTRRERRMYQAADRRAERRGARAAARYRRAHGH